MNGRSREQLKNLFIRVPEDLHARVKQEAERTGTPMNRIAIDALNLYLNSIQLTAHIDTSSGDVTIMIDENEVKKLEDLND